MNADKHKNEEPVHWEIALPKPAALEAAKASAPSMDAEAFAGFYQRTARPLWAYLARTSANPALAEDLMQESFVRFLSADRLAEVMTAGEVAARSYLFRIASNLLRDHWRRPGPEPLDAAPEAFFADSSAAQASDSHLLLGPALAQLRPRDRQLLWLAYAEGYSHREIAAITGLVSASVRLLLFRARRKVLHILDEAECGKRGKSGTGIKPSDRRQP
ncbi:MAG: sigma-70 family RNA polymerase sigma factor [Terracidiphilus sp.]|nr:sigma-70 family RNA polymerase sigma factor [Terracidiphilus sp.]